MCSGAVARAGVGNTPDRAARVVSDQQRSILGNREGGRTPPYFCASFAGYPEPSGKILIEAFRSAIREWHAHDLIAGRLGTIPRAFQCNESAVLVFRGELVDRVEDDVQD